MRIVFIGGIREQFESRIRIAAADEQRETLRVFSPIIELRV